MSNEVKEAEIDQLIDFMAELGNLEVQIRAFRESIEPLANELYRAWEQSQD